MIKKKQAKSGFTLIELLIAALIFSIIIISIYSTFQTGILSYKKIDSAFEVYQAARIILKRMELDLKNAFIYGQEDSKFKGSPQALNFFTTVDSFEKGRMYTNICRIKYEFSDNKLKRAYYKGLDALIETQDAIGEELNSDIQEVTFNYAYATNIPEKPYDWADNWPKEDDVNQKKNLPLAVKIKISLRQKDKALQEGRVIEFNKIVPLPLSTNTAAMPSTEGGTS
jgi:type II secretion system protein J